MKIRPTREWWVCLCDALGNVSHKPIGEYLRWNRSACVDGTATSPIPVALAGSLERSQEAGRIVKRQISAVRSGEDFTTEDTKGYKNER